MAMRFRTITPSNPVTTAARHVAMPTATMPEADLLQRETTRPVNAPPGRS
jgi:hypothetical protein